MSIFLSIAELPHTIAVLIKWATHVPYRTLGPETHWNETQVMKETNEQPLHVIQILQGVGGIGPDGAASPSSDK